MNIRSKESDLKDLLSNIERLDKEIRHKSKKLISMRNVWLGLKGWDITSVQIGPTRTFLYKKYGESFTCEHYAIDREIQGAL
jgi:hypothetical protein